MEIDCWDSVSCFRCMALLLNHWVLSTTIATLSQHRTHLNKNRLPDLQGGSFWSWQLALMPGNFALF